MANTDIYLRDILDQPASLKTSLDSVDAGQLDRLARESARPRRVVFAGMGSSNFCAIPAATYLSRSGIAASVVSAGQLLHYELPTLDADTTLVLVSQSGRSAEVVGIIERLPDALRVVGITNDLASPLAQRAQVVLGLNTAVEDSVTTRTYLASVALTLLLAEAMLGRDWRAMASQLRVAAKLLEVEVKRAAEHRDRVASFLGEPACIHLIGRGYSLASVRAGALFVREVAKHPAADFDSAEFRHGPLELVEAGFCAIVFAPEGLTHALSTSLAHDIATRGGRVVLITSQQPSWTHPNVCVVVQPHPPCEMLAPLIDVVPVQLLANSLALAKGHVPGVFRWSSKITSVE